MATGEEWSIGYARQAAADFKTFQFIQDQPVPECHKLQFLQMACEKLVKAHLCGAGTPPALLQTSHAYIAKNLPVVIRQQAVFLRFSEGKAREAMRQVRLLALEIELLAPSVDRGGQRPDNCEYPWEDNNGCLHAPLDWQFQPLDLLVRPCGPAILKLIYEAIQRLLCLSK